MSKQQSDQGATAKPVHGHNTVRVNPLHRPKGIWQLRHLVQLPCPLQCRPAGNFPDNPANLSSQQANAKDANGIHTPRSALGQDTASKDDQWAAQQLAVNGEEVVGKVRLPQYLLLSRTLLTQPLGKQASAPYTAAPVAL